MADTREGSTALAPSLWRMLEETASVTGEAFFVAASRAIAAATGARHALIAELVAPDRLRVLAWIGDASASPVSEQPVAGSVGAEVLKLGVAAYADGVAARFPNDAALAAVAARGYVGAGIWSTEHRPLGIVAAFSSATLPDAAALVPLASAFGTRVAAEIERARVERALRRQGELAEASAAISATLNDFSSRTSVALERACRVIQTVLDVSCVFVASVDRSRDELALAAHVGIPVSAEPTLPNAREFLQAHARRFDPFSVIEDAASIDPAAAPLFAALNLQSGVTALVGTPEDPIGLLAACSVGGPRSFSRPELHFLRLVADRCGQALSAALMHEELRASEARYRQIVTTCAEGVWSIDSRARTTFVNPQMAAMLGYEPAEMLGRSVADFADATSAKQLDGILERRRKGMRERYETRFLRRDGSELWAQVSTSPIFDEAGNFTGSIGLFTDITERRGLELKILQAQKLESLGKLAGGIAHDFNNLLVGILGNVGLALLDTAPESPLVPVLEDIREAATRAADLTKQMLAYSGKGRFVPQRLKLNQLIEDMAHLIASAVNKKATLRLSLAVGLPPVEADAAQLRQVVLNLVSNASDALGDAPGNISIATGVVIADREYLGTTFLDEGLPVGRYVFFEVSDSGSGMDAQTKARIFDPFFTTKFMGRGLGLAAVLGILRGHRAAIRVESEPSCGSTFRVLLRALDGSVSELDERAPTSSAATRAPELVLVADDEPSVRSVARRVLERNGFRVLLAADGKEAVRLYAQHQHEIALVLLDMTMPELGGEEVFQEIRKIDPGVRVVLSSGYDEQDATARFVGKGLAGFLRKPWLPEELLGALNQALA